MRKCRPQSALLILIIASSMVCFPVYLFFYECPVVYWKGQAGLFEYLKKGIACHPTVYKMKAVAWYYTDNKCHGHFASVSTITWKTPIKEHTAGNLYQ